MQDWSVRRWESLKSRRMRPTFPGHRRHGGAPVRMQLSRETVYTPKDKSGLLQSYAERSVSLLTQPAALKYPSPSFHAVPQMFVKWVKCSRDCHSFLPASKHSNILCWPMLKLLLLQYSKCCYTLLGGTMAGIEIEWLEDFRIHPSQWVENLISNLVEEIWGREETSKSEVMPHSPDTTVALWHKPRPLCISGRADMKQNSPRQCQRSGIHPPLQSQESGNGTRACPERRSSCPLPSRGSIHRRRGEGREQRSLKFAARLRHEGRLLAQLLRHILLTWGCQSTLRTLRENAAHR